MSYDYASIELLDSLALDSEGDQVAVWDVRPFRLVSLFEMLQFYAGLFFSGIRLVTRKLPLTSHKWALKFQLTQLEPADSVQPSILSRLADSRDNNP